MTQKRELKENEIGFIPIDEDNYLVIRLDQILNDKPLYKIHYWSERMKYFSGHYSLTAQEMKMKLGQLLQSNSMYKL